MPREFPEWEMSDDDRRQLSARAEGGLWGGLPEVPETPEEVRRLQDRYGRDNLVAWLSGTTDRKSRAWKSARDGLSRRRAGRTGIGPQWRNKFQTASRRGRSGRVRGRGSLHVSLTADIRTSRTWDYGRTMTADLTGADLDEFLQAVEENRYEDAATIVADNYGLSSDFILEIANVSGFETDAAGAESYDEDEE